MKRTIEDVYDVAVRTETKLESFMAAQAVKNKTATFIAVTAIGAGVGIAVNMVNT